MCSGGSKDKPTEKVVQRTVWPSYLVTKDDFREGQPRKVEVTLPARLSDAELANVAEAIHTDTEFNAKKTFIGFRVEGQTDNAYWANASFDPDFRSSLNGLSASDYESLKAQDLTAYPDVIGSWLQDGALGHLKVLYKRDGKYFIDSIFPDGGKNTERYLSKRLTDGGLHLEEPENDFGEYYVVDAKGNLQGWGKKGVYMTLPPNRPAI
jgi:hypothetical protein